MYGARTMLLNYSCTLESPGEFWQNTDLQSPPRTNIRISGCGNYTVQGFAGDSDVQPGFENYFLSV